MRDLEGAKDPEGPLYRIGRLPDPLVFPPWEYAGGGRFDDPKREFRTLYAAESRLEPFIELLAPFRPSPEVIAALGAVSNATDERFEVGVIPSDWARKRCVRAFRLGPSQCWLDLRSLQTREALRYLLAEDLVRLGLNDLDVSDTRGRRRELTQLISRFAYEAGYSGLVYRSRFDDDICCWAIFEGAEIQPIGVIEPILPTDPDLLLAAKLFKLELESQARPTEER